MAEQTAKHTGVDMTEGPIAKQIIWFTIPLMLGNMFQQLYNAADTIIVGRFVGVEALAAVGATGTIMFLIFNIPRNYFRTQI